MVVAAAAGTMTDEETTAVEDLPVIAIGIVMYMAAEGGMMIVTAVAVKEEVKVRVCYVQ